MSRSEQWLGKYPLVSVLGTGSTGVIYRSVDPRTLQPVALKILQRDMLDDPTGQEFASQLRSEGEAAQHLAHPGIVAVREYGEAWPYSYISMEYVEGRSLQARLDEGTVFSLSRTLAIMVQLLEALQHAHELGIWHRDVKPSNLLLTREDRLKVIDFGIARIKSSGAAWRSLILGTPGYTAPETYLSETFDHRVDVFAAGAVLYLLLAGVPPFYGTAHAIMLQVCFGTPRPPSVAGRSSCVRPLDAVVMRALARDPGERFGSAAQFRAALLQAHGAGGRY